MDSLVFILFGVITGVGSALLLLRFDGTWIKAISLTGGSSILVGEFLLFANLLGVDEQNRSIMMVCLLLSWLITFFVFLVIPLQLFKRQDTNYKIQIWEILLGDRKAIDHYYTSKQEEISQKVKGDYNFDKLAKRKNNLDKKEEALSHQLQYLNNIRDDVDAILDKKHCLDIPRGFKFPIKSDFFELLPRYVKSVSDFEHHLNSFTDSFLNDLKSHRNKHSNTQALTTYLHGVSYYIGQYLFDWRDVRVHFRSLNKKNNCYEKFLAVHKTGQDYSESLTDIPISNSLITIATETKRSIVFSANRKNAFNTNSSHIWTDYITIVFERFKSNNLPVLSLGISVKHHADHKEMLYFLSYIQIEQVIQNNLLRIDDIFSICNALTTEAA